MDYRERIVQFYFGLSLTRWKWAYNTLDSILFDLYHGDVGSDGCLPLYGGILFGLLGHVRGSFCSRGRGERDVAFAMICVWWKWDVGLAKFAIRSLLLDGDAQDFQRFARFLNSNTDFLGEDTVDDMLQYVIGTFVDALRQPNPLLQNACPREGNSMNWLYQRVLYRWVYPGYPLGEKMICSWQKRDFRQMLGSGSLNKKNCSLNEAANSVGWFVQLALDTRYNRTDKAADVNRMWERNTRCFVNVSHVIPIADISAHNTEDALMNNIGFSLMIAMASIGGAGRLFLLAAGLHWIDVGGCTFCEAVWRIFDSPHFLRVGLDIGSLATLDSAVNTTRALGITVYLFTGDFQPELILREQGSRDCFVNAQRCKSSKNLGRPISLRRYKLVVWNTGCSGIGCSTVGCSGIGCSAVGCSGIGCSGSMNPMYLSGSNPGLLLSVVAAAAAGKSNFDIVAAFGMPDWVAYFEDNHTLASSASFA